MYSPCQWLDHWRNCLSTTRHPHTNPRRGLEATSVSYPQQAQSCVGLVLWSQLLWNLRWSSHVIPVTQPPTLPSLALALSPRPFSTMSYKPWVGVIHVLFMSEHPIVTYYLYFEQYGSLKLRKITAKSFSSLDPGLWKHLWILLWLEHKMFPACPFV